MKGTAAVTIGKDTYILAFQDWIQVQMYPYCIAVFIIGYYRKVIGKILLYYQLRLLIHEPFYRQRPAKQFRP